MFEITYTDKALDDLMSIPRKDVLKIRIKVNQYAENPLSLQNQVKKLTGEPYYRLRVGDYRVIFSKDGKVIQIEKVGHRKEIYR